MSTLFRSTGRGLAPSLQPDHSAPASGAAPVVVRGQPRASTILRPSRSHANLKPGREPTPYLLPKAAHSASNLPSPVISSSSSQSSQSSSSFPTQRPNLSPNLPTTPPTSDSDSSVVAAATPKARSRRSSKSEKKSKSAEMEKKGGGWSFLRSSKSVKRVNKDVAPPPSTTPRSPPPPLPLPNFAFESPSSSPPLERPHERDLAARRGCVAAHERDGTSPGTPATFRPDIPVEEEDLASLLHFVTAAADKFSTSSTDHSSLPNFAAPSSSAFATADAPPSPAEWVAPPSPSSPPPIKKYAFLSHLDPVNRSGSGGGKYDLPSSLTASPRLWRASSAAGPAANNRWKQPIVAPEPASDDDYGESDGEDAGGWAKTPNSAFQRAVAATARASSASPTSTRKRELGPRARALLERTHAKLKGDERDQGVARPLSTTRSNVLRGRVVGTSAVLGRMAIDRKLRRGITMLEERELEPHGGVGESDRSRYESAASGSDSSSDDDRTWNVRSTKKPCSASEHVNVVDQFPPVSLSAALAPTMRDSPAFVESARPSPRPIQPSHPLPSSISSPTGPNELPTPAGLATWLRRPSSADCHLVTVAVEGGVLTDLIRQRPNQPPLRPSPRVLFLARPRSTSSVPSNPHRPSRERQLSYTSSASSSQSRSLSRSSGLSTPVSFGGAPTRRLVLPGPLFFKALANGEVSYEDDGGAKEDAGQVEEEDLPLALLKNSQEALRRAQDKANLLEVEVARLRTSEASKENQARLDRERMEREVAREMEREEMERENEVRRRSAEQRRRSRATGQGQATDEWSAVAKGKGKGKEVRRVSQLPPPPAPRREASLPSSSSAPQLHRPQLPAPWGSPAGHLVPMAPYGYPAMMMAPRGLPMMPPPPPGAFYASPAFTTSAPTLAPAYYLPAPFPQFDLPLPNVVDYSLPSRAYTPSGRPHAPQPLHSQPPPLPLQPQRLSRSPLASPPPSPHHLGAYRSPTAPPANLAPPPPIPFRQSTSPAPGGRFVRSASAPQIEVIGATAAVVGSKEGGLQVKGSAGRRVSFVQF